jgi:hypothetical protein
VSPRWTGPTLSDKCPNDLKPLHADGAESYGRQLVDAGVGTLGNRSECGMIEVLKPDVACSVGAAHGEGPV